MNIENPITSTHQGGPAKNTQLLLMGLDGLRPYQDKVDDLKSVLETLEDLGDETTAKSASKLQQQLRAVEASITMIGQVKAGKTSLVNAMAGWPDLLPADVNPWTSVVTSIHMNPDAYPHGNHASFQFFEQEEWSRLMERGGRVGELASRAGAQDELEKIRVQIEEMREKSRKRLGKKFELLLGQQHDYGYFDSDLIERYVCLGDDFEDDIDLASNQGRFADITKSADLFLQRAEVPVPLCIRDTPGVNDTFMMREQITIRAIRESRLCVVVLSAHQALSAVDMALIRLISNVKSREVIIFVNRIDELADPAAQVPEIRESIRNTLRAHHGPEDAQIIFGSAYWANHALQGGLAELDQASSAALLNWAEGEMAVDTSLLSVEEMVWELSGVPELFHALADRIEEGVGQESIDRIARRAMNLANGVQTKARLAFNVSPGTATTDMDVDQLMRRLDAVEENRATAMTAKFDKILQDFHRRLDRSHKSFLDRATAALVSHLETFGDEAVWSYDPTGLRILLRSAYQVFSKNALAGMDSIFEEAVVDLRAIYVEAFGADAGKVEIQKPAPPRIAPPVLLGQTIALDLKGNWWSRWWQRRRGFKAYAVEFADMIRAETDPIINGLKSAHSEAAVDDARRVLREFLQDQRLILTNLLQQSGATPLKSDVDTTNEDIQDRMDETLAILGKYTA